jgi:release factor glutamine methyltransferase
LPYVATAEIDALAAEVRAEPRQALDGGEDGLGLIRRLVSGVLPWLRPGGWIALEHGAQQAEAVRRLCADAGLVSIASQADLGGLERVTASRAPGTTSELARADRQVYPGEG